MKISKKAAMGISLAIGTLMFATTAFAEVASKNGYEQLKDTLKLSADSTSKFQNYTFETSVVIKDGSTIINQEDDVNKYDNSKKVMEHSSSIVNRDGSKSGNYSYSDSNCDIFYDQNSDTYNETDYSTAKKGTFIFDNPFKVKGSADIEKIVDAVVGNLKDYVVVNQKADGSKELSGSISQAQIPAVANAIVSYAVKNKFGNPYTTARLKINKITDDIYVKQVKGNVVVGKDGLMQSGIGTGVISGKDEKGNVHDLTYEVLLKFENINSTSVKKPDLTGKKVVKNTKDNIDGSDDTSLTNPQMYIGTYKNNIIISKDNKFQKIGERILEITSIDNKKVAGKYHEEYIKGYEEYSKNAKEIKFEASFDAQQKNNANIKVNDGEKVISGNIFFDKYSAEINFSFERSSNQGVLDNCQYSRVFN